MESFQHYAALQVKNDFSKESSVTAMYKDLDFYRPEAVVTPYLTVSQTGVNSFV